MLPKFLMSSVNPDQLGLTVKGFLLGLVPVVLVVAGAAHWNVGQEDVTNFVDAVTALVIGASSAMSALMIIWGLLRKVFVKMGWIQPQV